MGVTSITIGLDDELSARLANEAERAGVTPAALVGSILATHLTPGPPTDDDPAAFGFIGVGASDVLAGRSVNGLLADGFGQ